AQGNPLALTTGPAFQGADQGSTDRNLPGGDTGTYTATYQINQSDVDSGGITNSVVANGLSPANTAVSDISDNGNDTDGNTTDESSVMPCAGNPEIEVTETAAVADSGDGRTGVGDVVTYSFFDRNAGNLGLHSFPTRRSSELAQGNPLALTTGPAFQGADQGS